MHETVVVGIVPNQNKAVFSAAAELARDMGAQLVYCFCDMSSAAEPQRPGTARVISSYPQKVKLEDSPLNEAWQRVEDKLLKEVAGNMAATGVEWDFLHLADEPVPGLTALADKLDARCIVVGTREPGPGPRLRELLGGSVASGLAHRQSRPVLVVPISPKKDLELDHD